MVPYFFFGGGGLGAWNRMVKYKGLEKNVCEQSNVIKRGILTVYVTVHREIFAKDESMTVTE
jgi:hypothetical protein